MKNKIDGIKFRNKELSIKDLLVMLILIETIKGLFWCLIVL